MGDILPFVAKVRASGDWTASERARLENLADQFAAGGAKVEVVFGTTEEGDPWCVVKDEQEEVLVHVARIGGRFVVHYAVEDALEEGVDLHTALSNRLAADAEHDDVVVPFGVGGRHAQTFIALVVAAAFFYETQDVAVAAETGGEPLQMNPAPEEAASLPASDDLALRQDRDLTANGSMFADPAPVAATAAQSVAPAPEAAAPTVASLAEPADQPVAVAAQTEDADDDQPAPEGPTAAAATPARTEIVGTDGDDHLVGTAGADHILGGAGADTLQGGGAGQGEMDLLDGGLGDDRIEVNAQVVATGGEGADTFVIQAPTVMGEASTLLGVLTDFSMSEGDRMVNARGEAVIIFPAPPGRTGGPDEAPPAGLQSLTGPSTPSSFTPDRQVNVDLDGDGDVDGYVLLTNARDAATFELPSDVSTDREDTIVMVRSVFDYTDFS